MNSEDLHPGKMLLAVAMALLTAFMGALAFKDSRLLAVAITLTGWLFYILWLCSDVHNIPRHRMAAVVGFTCLLALTPAPWYLAASHRNPDTLYFVVDVRDQMKDTWIFVTGHSKRYGSEYNNNSEQIQYLESLVQEQSELTLAGLRSIGGDEGTELSECGKSSQIVPISSIGDNATHIIFPEIWPAGSSSVVNSIVRALDMDLYNPPGTVKLVIIISANHLICTDESLSANYRYLERARKEFAERTSQRIDVVIVNVADTIDPRSLQIANCYAMALQGVFVNRPETGELVALLNNDRLNYFWEAGDAERCLL